ncbi:YfgJ family double zinc ribbon protein [Utexia brackfieldae]|uniref:YfgJ family double zinc ribbon protein n=1 Tax=Utexia brackfieldae TaxID=3074108 RepID=UPI00370D1582
MTTIACHENSCPICLGDLVVEKPDRRYCPHCKQHFVEKVLCPKCHDFVECIIGCGAINYLCRKDGLVSKSKIEYQYLPIE